MNFIKDAVMVFPWHPTTGAYGLMHSTSLPNPITMTGNLFLREGQPMLQNQFPRKITTAIATGSKAYDTLTPGFDLVDLLDTSDSETAYSRSNRNFNFSRCETIWTELT